MSKQNLPIIVANLCALLPHFHKKHCFTHHHHASLINYLLAFSFTCHQVLFPN